MNVNRDDRFGLRPLLALLVAMAASAGCDNATQVKEFAVATPSGSRQGEPGHPNSSWIGYNVRELIDLYGEPQEIIDARLPGGPPSDAYLYRSLQDDGCVDAFVVVAQTGEIIDYFCR